MSDPIVGEVRRIRDEHAARFNYDLVAIYRDLKEQERLSGRRFLNLTVEHGSRGDSPTLEPSVHETDSN